MSRAGGRTLEKSLPHTVASIARVIPEVALDKTFDYAIPEEFAGAIGPGTRVRVPFGGREILGCVVELPEQAEVARLKPVLGLVAAEAPVPAALLRLAYWMADYYCTPLSVALRTVLPEAVRRKEAGFKERLWVEAATLAATAEAPSLPPARAPLQKRAWEFLQAHGPGWLSELCQESQTTPAAWRGLEARGLVTIRRSAQERDPFAGDAAALPTEPLTLNPEQAAALETVIQPAPPAHRVVLLHGVTGSGKTEVYLQAIAHCLAQGRSAIVLVPEIALTPQTVDRFRSRFSAAGVRVAVLHSHLSAGERHDEWHAIRQGRARIIIGARSAIFAPVERLGLLVVDEEHEPSYKQDEAPHYHARDIAVLRGHFEQVPVVLGSATPSLESFSNAREGKYLLARLTRRAEDVSLPITHVLDLRQEAKSKAVGGSGPVSRRPLLAARLTAAIQERLNRKEQVILFLNRRGYASSLQCPACGHVETSPTCSIPLTYHRRGDRLVCHLSGFSKPAPAHCPACGFEGFKQKGVGTQKIEEELARLFPDARVMRMDSDSMQTKHAYRDTFRAFAEGRIDILIGTQMIAKGLHFPNVTCVGVVHADLALQLPDFRASERVFQLLMQVSGRSGRGLKPGEVFVQTFTPFHPAIQFARHHDYDGFADQELEFRQALGYPPFRRAILVGWRGRDEAKTRYVAQQMTRQIREALLPAGADVPEPAPAPIEKIHDEFRFHLFIQTGKTKLLRATRLLRPIALDPTGRKRPLPDGIKFSIDVDPMHLL